MRVMGEIAAKPPQKQQTLIKKQRSDTANKVVNNGKKKSSGHTNKTNSSNAPSGISKTPDINKQQSRLGSNSDDKDSQNSELGADLFAARENVTESKRTRRRFESDMVDADD